LTHAGRSRLLRVIEGGFVPYQAALEWQRGLAAAKKQDRSADDYLLLLEHNPVLTLGRGADPANLTVSDERLRELGIDCVEIERGGDITYHGPGQLIGYPILDLTHYRRDLHWYLRQLEAALIATLAGFGVSAFPFPGYTGVWVGEQGGVGPSAAEPTGPGSPDDASLQRRIAAGRVRKIASIGVHVSRWVTWHGFALNVTDQPLHAFRLITPCGIDGVHMTSLQSEGVAVQPDSRQLLETLRLSFAEAFQAQTTADSGQPADLASLVHE
jgi:lipoyl(octanoyl) transferase